MKCIVPDYDPAKNGVTQSLIQTFMECRKKALLSLQRWSSTRTSMPLFFGNLFHAACEFHYEHLTRGKPVPAQKSVDFAKRVAEEEIKGKRTHRSPEEEQQIEMAILVLETLFPAYVKFYQKKDAAMKWVGSEHEFEVEYNDVVLRGKMDGRFTAGRKTWIKDTKTKGRIEEANMLDLLALDVQIGFYILAEETALKSKVHGFQYDIVRRPELRLGAKENMGQFQRRMGEDIVKRPEHYFKRINLDLSGEEHERFRQDFLVVLDEFTRWLSGDPLVPTYHRTTSCMTRYGACTYLPICARQDFTGFLKREDIFPELEG